MADIQAVQAAILSFINEADWAVRKQRVERHRDLLLTDDADAWLAAGAANNAARPDVRERLESCRGVLAACRAIGIDAAFVLLLGPTPGLMEAVKDLVAAESATAAYQTTVQHQAILLTDEADWLLAALAYENADHDFFVERMESRRRLLRCCRSEGVDAAFADLVREDRLHEALSDLVTALGTPMAVGPLLDQHRDLLLSDDAIRSVDKLATGQDPDSEVGRAFTAMRSLLRIAREDGVRMACALYTLPPFEQFLFRCFNALAKPGDPASAPGADIAAVLQSDFDQVSGGFAEALDDWCQHNPEPAAAGTLKLYASGLARLGEALEGHASGREKLAQGAALACFDGQARFTQRLAALRQRQARAVEVFATVDDAVAAALRLQAEQGFDLFRGQRCDWPVMSSYRRLDVRRQADAMSRVNQFINWAKREAALARHRLSSDQTIAIGQHHGLATTFIDFTTDVDVARFFATEHCLAAAGPGQATDAGHSCIVAARSDHLERWVNERFQRADEFLGSQILRLDVPGLWRLEAQAGLFLVDDDLLDDYPFHCLLFPAAAGSQPARSRASVYPEKKSELESVLDQWFLHERASAGMRDVVNMLKEGGARFRTLNLEPTDGIGLKGIVRPGVHPSWPAAGTTWSRAPERLAHALPSPDDRFVMDLRTGMGQDELRALAEAQVPAGTLANRRARAADWIVRVDHQTDADASDRLARQWNALRVDGYTDAQVAASMAASVVFLALQRGLMPAHPRGGGDRSGGVDVAALKELVGGDLVVEFKGLVGYGRAVVNAQDLRAAVRDDIDRYLPADLYDACGPSIAERMGRLLTGIHAPNLLFDFSRFADVYVRQVIPNAAIFRPDLPLYSPMHLQTFSVP